MDHRLDVPLDLVLLMLVGCVGLSLDAVLGVVRAYLSRLERGENVGVDDRDLDAVLLVVITAEHNIRIRSYYRPIEELRTEHAARLAANEHDRSPT